jgi:hypothetical protein
MCGLDVSVSYQSVESLFFGRPRAFGPFSHTPAADDVTQDRQFLIVDDRDFGHGRALHRSCGEFRSCRLPSIVVDGVIPPKRHPGRLEDPNVTANAPTRLAQHKIFEQEVKLAGGQGAAVGSPEAIRRPPRAHEFGARTYALCYHV